ncbi:MAG: DNA polymerase IV [Dehalococcoidia bacterium]|nr:DNA polymerase IV [Dehalococcoidia bacterium]
MAGQRTILHADMDAFYASVEQRDRPELRGRPVVVGGAPEARGVVAAASYEARAFGVRSALPMSRALRLCPEAVRVSPRFDRYGEVSRQVMAVFRSMTPLIEPLSLDEAFLDITMQTTAHGGAEAAARRLKAEVRRVTALNVSIGGGANKTVAKIASDAGKPDGLLIVAAGAERAFLAPLPIRALSGIGPKAEALLTAAGIRTIGELAEADAGQLERMFGSRGVQLREMARGIDQRPVEPVQERKSISAETTFAHDVVDGSDLRQELRRLADEAARRLRERRMRARTIVLKLRYSNFRTITRRATRAQPTDERDVIAGEAERLLDVVVEPGDRFRLIGVTCGHLSGLEASGQLSLWAPGDARATPAGDAKL